MKTLIFEEQLVGEEPPSELCNELLALHFHIRGEPKESGHRLGDDQDVKCQKVPTSIERCPTGCFEFEQLKVKWIQEERLNAVASLHQTRLCSAFPKTTFTLSSGAQSPLHSEKPQKEKKRKKEEKDKLSFLCISKNNFYSGLTH